MVSKSRDSFASDSNYRLWLEKTNELLSELENELSVLKDPGEYEQLPPAVVAEELGTTTSKVRLLIKSGEIIASGRPAHEYVSREELETACEAGVKELSRRLGQGAAEIFEESVTYLHRGQMPLAERACYRLLARESIVGAHALPYETALLLAKADIDTVNTRLAFIRRKEATERAHLIHTLQGILSAMSLQNDTAKAIAERLLYGGEECSVDSRKVLGSRLDDLQQLSMFITTVLFDEINKWFKRPLRADEVEDLREVIQTAVYSSLYAHESYEQLASSREFVDAIKALMPRYFKPAGLIRGLVINH